MLALVRVKIDSISCKQLGAGAEVLKTEVSDLGLYTSSSGLICRWIMYVRI
jgi:hypothetical protein